MTNLSVSTLKKLQEQLAQDHVQKITEYYHKGLNQTEISKLIGLSRQKVNGYFKKLGFSKQN